MANQFGMIVVFADVPQDQGGEPAIETILDEIGGHFIREMPAPAHHALLDGPRIRADAQHLQIVIGLEHNQVRSAQVNSQRVRYVP